MANEPNIAELAVAAWRLERWLDNLVAERKMAAKSSLRSIKKFLDASGIEIVDPVGWKFDPGLPIEVVNNEAPDVDEARLIVIETNAPIIKKDDIPIQFGRVILGVDIKEQKSNSEIKTEEKTKTTSEQTQEEKKAKQKLPYHVTKIELYEEHDGYEYWIAVKMGLHALNNSLKVFLMDKFTFKDFRNGSKVQPADGYVQKKEVDYLRVPYQGEWYVIVANDAYDWKPEYEVEIEHGWVKMPPKEKDDSANSQNTENSENAKEQEAVQENSTNSSEMGESSGNDVIMDTEELDTAHEEKTEVVISDKAAEKLAKKNNASYYIQKAKMAGVLKGSHGKSKKKGKKH